jgi:ABC-2 type transport system permease protein
MSYQLLSAEREDGTLALLLSQPVTVATVLGGKVVARLLLLLSVVSVVVVIACVVGGVNVAAAETGSRLMLVIVTLVVYALVWFSLAVLVNLLGWPSPVNAVALLAVWLAVVIVAPATVNVLAIRLYPAASRVELIQAIRRATDAADARAAELLGQYFQDHPDLVPASANASMSDFYSRTIAVQADAEEATRPVMARFAAQTNAQRRLVDRFQFLSPPVLVRGALDDLAGTSEARYRDFINQIDNYHLGWRAFFVPRIMHQSKMAAADYDQIPVFHYVAEAEARVRSRVWRSITGLLLALAALVGASIVLGARYRLTSWS